MSLYFTICSNNYISFARVLGASIKHYNPGARFVLFLCDEKVAEIDYEDVADETIVLSAIEPRFNELAERYNIIELNTSLKPRAFEYIFELGYVQAIYLDPDICVYASLSSVEMEFTDFSVLLTPHIYTPIPFDDKKPDEATFLNFGIYNLGFIGLKKKDQVNSLLSWWKNWTYEKGYIDVYNGIFVDQLPMNYAPVFFRDVKILQDFGLNMAPWNLHERRLSAKDDGFYVNGTDRLKFYHFSSFAVDKFELPIHRYTRFTIASRTDLLPIYQQYNIAVKEAGHTQTCILKDAYEELRKAFKKKKKRNKWLRKFGLATTSSNRLP